MGNLLIAYPHLYIGTPGEMAPKQKSLEVIKQRRFRLNQALSDLLAAILKDGLDAMIGIKYVEISVDTLAIRYDLLQATEEQIESRILQVDRKLLDGWADRCSAALSILHNGFSGVESGQELSCLALGFPRNTTYNVYYVKLWR